MKLEDSALVEEVRNLTDKTKAAVQCTDDYVHENPWVAVGAAAIAGILVGLLLVPRR